MRRTPEPRRTFESRCATQNAKITVTGTVMAMIHAVLRTAGQKLASVFMYRKFARPTQRGGESRS